MARLSVRSAFLLSGVILQAHVPGAWGQGSTPEHRLPADAADEQGPASSLPPRATDSSALNDLPSEGQDPPARVGRIAKLHGQASFRAESSDEWEPTSPNMAVTAGTALSTRTGSRVAIDINASVLAIEGVSDIEIARLDEAGLIATLPQGTLFLHLRNMRSTEAAEIVTPTARVIFRSNTRAVVMTGPAQRPLFVNVLAGGPVEVLPSDGDGAGFTIKANESAIIQTQDGALTATRERGSSGLSLAGWATRNPPRAQALPASVQHITGGQSLAYSGHWDRHVDHGEVWYPPVNDGWRPFQEGRWMWREPWGWTWVDEADWGFATSHYGRWIQVNNRWGWTPAIVQRDPTIHVGYASPPYPAWAPAVVAFVGGAAIVGTAAYLMTRPHHRDHAPVGWAPLGPREPYYPWWRASPRYVTHVNQRHVTNITQVNNTWITNVTQAPRERGEGRQAYQRPLMHASAATYVPPEAMARSQRVAQVAQPAPTGAPAQSTIGVLPVAPSAETTGTNTRTAQRYGFQRPTATPIGTPQPGTIQPGTALPGGSPSGTTPSASPQSPGTTAQVPQRPGATGGDRAGVSPIPGTVSPPTGLPQDAHRRLVQDLSRPPAAPRIPPVGTIQGSPNERAGQPSVGSASGQRSGLPTAPSADVRDNRAPQTPPATTAMPQGTAPLASPVSNPTGAPVPSGPAGAAAPQGHGTATASPPASSAVAPTGNPGVPATTEAPPSAGSGPSIGTAAAIGGGAIVGGAAAAIAAGRAGQRTTPPTNAPSAPQSRAPQSRAPLEMQPPSNGQGLAGRSPASPTGAPAPLPPPTDRAGAPSPAITRPLPGAPALPGAGATPTINPAVRERPLPTNPGLSAQPQAPLAASPSAPRPLQTLPGASAPVRPLARDGNSPPGPGVTTPPASSPAITPSPRNVGPTPSSTPQPMPNRPLPQRDPTMSGPSSLSAPQPSQPEPRFQAPTPQIPSYRPPPSAPPPSIGMSPSRPSGVGGAPSAAPMMRPAPSYASPPPSYSRPSTPPPAARPQAPAFANPRDKTRH